MSLRDRGVPTVSEVIQNLKSYPPDAHVIVYEEVREVESMMMQCNSGIRIVSSDSDENNPEQIGFILTGH